MGLLSYSSYLIHQPIIAVLKYRLLSDANPWVMGAACVAVLPLAFLSWRYVESPFRDRKRVGRRFIFCSASACSALFVVVGVYGYIKDGFSDYYFSNLGSDSAKKYYSYIGYFGGSRFNEQFRHGSCFIQSESEDFSKFKKDECLQSLPDRSNILLLGDSHAAHYAQTFKEMFPANLLQATGAGCRLLVPAKGRPSCKDLVNYIFDEYLPQQDQFQAIILARRWSYDDIEQIQQTIEALLIHTNKLIIIVLLLSILRSSNAVG
jgi:hypothetical protein